MRRRRDEREKIVEVQASDTGVLGVGFPAKVLVYGNGFLPGPESLEIDFAAPETEEQSEESPQERRRARSL